MKKSLVTFLMILSCGGAMALPVGNPGDATLYQDGWFWEGNPCCDPCDPCAWWSDWLSFRMGFYGDYVFDRYLEVAEGPTEGDDIQSSEIHTNAGYMALNFCNIFDVFGTLGISKIRVESFGESFGIATSIPFEVVSESFFSWSVGGRLTIWECECFYLGLEGQYFATNPDITYVRLETQGPFYFSENDEIHYSEWQVALGVAQRFSLGCPEVALIPYVAAKWSEAKMEMNAQTMTALLSDLESKKKWGWALGATLTVADIVGVTVEGRWGEERAISVNSQVRF